MNIPSLEDIIKASGLHPSRVFNVYLFGSQVYGSSNKDSDWDIIIVANNSVESIEISSGDYNIHIYTPKKFGEDLDWHRINNLECIFAPDWAKLKEDIKFHFKLDLPKLRHATSHISSNSFIKSHKKIGQGDYYIGLKSLFHSIRIPMFAIQIINSGHINDFSCANHIWNDLIRVDFDISEIDIKYKSIRNNILSDFRKISSKGN